MIHVITVALAVNVRAPAYYFGNVRSPSDAHATAPDVPPPLLTWQLHAACYLGWGGAWACGNVGLSIRLPTHPRMLCACKHCLQQGGARCVCVCVCAPRCVCSAAHMHAMCASRTSTPCALAVHAPVRPPPLPPPPNEVLAHSGWFRSAAFIVLGGRRWLAPIGQLARYRHCEENSYPSALHARRLLMVSSIPACQTSMQPLVVVPAH